MGWIDDPTPKFYHGVSPTLRASGGGRCPGGFLTAVHAAPFTPRECERLQGFPDDYTAVTFRGRAATDKQRRSALGNSFPVPILCWIGQRIDFLEKIDHE